MYIQFNATFTFPYSSIINMTLQSNHITLHASKITHIPVLDTVPVS